MKKKIFIIFLLLGFCKTKCMRNHALENACRRNETKTVRLLFESLHTTDQHGYTPLYWACRNNNFEIVEMLFENGADWSVNIRGKDGYTPLLWACQNKNLKIIRLLFDHGAEESVNISSNKGYTPLYMACGGNEEDCQLEIINLLLDKGAINSINVPDKHAGYTPLHWACLGGSSKIVNVLIKNGALVHVLDQFGNTPLHMACSKENSLEIIELLLNCGAEKHINIPNKQGETPFVKPCVCGYLEIVQLLVEKGASYSINKLDERIQTLISRICDHRHTNLEMIKFLLENCIGEGANIGEINMIKIMASPANQAIKSYLQNIYNFQQAEDKMEFIITQISENNEYEYIQNVSSEEKFYKVSQKIKDMLRIVFCYSLKNILCNPELTEEDLCEENLFNDSLFFKLNVLALSHLQIKEALLQTFEVKNDSFLKTENFVCFIEHAIEKIDFRLAKSYDMLNKFTICKNFLEDSREERYNAFKEEDSLPKQPFEQTSHNFTECFVEEVLIDQEIGVDKVYINHEEEEEGEIADIVNDEGRSFICEDDVVQAVGLSKQRKQECSVCLDNKNKENFAMLHCGHEFCKNCLIYMVDLAIREKTTANLKCPNRECVVKINEQDVRCITDNDQAKLDSFAEITTQEWLSTEADAKRCPTSDCGFFFIAPGRAVRAVTCPRCFATYCSNCLHPHSIQVTCKVAEVARALAERRRTEEQQSEEWMRKNIKPCPKCGVGVQRDGGCLYVRCRCGHAFCFRCLGTHHVSEGGCHAPEVMPAPINQPENPMFSRQSQRREQGQTRQHSFSSEVSEEEVMWKRMKFKKDVGGGILRDVTYAELERQRVYQPHAYIDQIQPSGYQLQNTSDRTRRIKVAVKFHNKDRGGRFYAFYQNFCKFMLSSLSARGKISFNVLFKGPENPEGSICYEFFNHDFDLEEFKTILDQANQINLQPN